VSTPRYRHQVAIPYTGMQIQHATLVALYFKLTVSYPVSGTTTDWTNYSIYCGGPQNWRCCMQPAGPWWGTSDIQLAGTVSLPCLRNRQCKNTTWPLKVATIQYSEGSVTMYEPTLCNISEERKPQITELLLIKEDDLWSHFSER
jgi:hypothetical protein